MTREQQIALEQLDQVIAQWNEIKQYSGVGAEQTSRLVTRMRSVVARLAPPRSPYIEQARSTNEYNVIGVVRALRDDYAAGFMTTMREQINADLFSDFLEMAEYLLQDERLKQPAAVVAGGVLEEHLRKLCEKSGITTTTSAGPKKAALMNDELAKADIYGKNEHKQVTAWLGIRNSAAHAKTDEFDEYQVRNMIDGLRGFVSRFPA